MTRSALPKTLGGMVKPICLAAFRLTMNSSFFGCFDREIGRLGVFQDLVHIRLGPSVQVVEITHRESGEVEGDE
jgi:hypothetical protein